MEQCCGKRKIKTQFDDLVTLEDLIPLETDVNGNFESIDMNERVIIGHNVGFDRTFVREQYFIQVCYKC